MKLIDADKMRDDWLENGENEFVYDTNAVLESIDAQPTVDAAPVVPGHWVSDESDVLFHCSECETQISTSWDYDDLQWNYCPNCGAKMGGDPDV